MAKRKARKRTGLYKSTKGGGSLKGSGINVGNPDKVARESQARLAKWAKGMKGL